MKSIASGPAPSRFDPLVQGGNPRASRPVKSAQVSRGVHAVRTAADTFGAHRATALSVKTSTTHPRRSLPPLGRYLGRPLEQASRALPSRRSLPRRRAASLARCGMSSDVFPSPSSLLCVPFHIAELRIGADLFADFRSSLRRLCTSCASSLPSLLVLVADFHDHRTTRTTPKRPAPSRPTQP